MSAEIRPSVHNFTCLLCRPLGLSGRPCGATVGAAWDESREYGRKAARKSKWRKLFPASANALASRRPETLMGSVDRGSAALQFAPAGVEQEIIEPVEQVLSLDRKVN